MFIFFSKSVSKPDVFYGGDTICIFQGCVLYAYPWKDCFEQRQSRGMCRNVREHLMQSQVSSLAQICQGLVDYLNILIRASCGRQIVGMEFSEECSIMSAFKELKVFLKDKENNMSHLQKSTIITVVIQTGKSTIRRKRILTKGN